MVADYEYLLNAARDAGLPITLISTYNAVNREQVLRAELASDREKYVLIRLADLAMANHPDPKAFLDEQAVVALRDLLERLGFREAVEALARAYGLIDKLRARIMVMEEAMAAGA